MSCQSNEHLSQLVALLRQDNQRLTLLESVRALSEPSCKLYVAAGFIRNLVWDSLHQYHLATPFNDIDVIYFNTNDKGQVKERFIENVLSNQHPSFRWQVKNQARMHVRNGDEAYQSLQHAMTYWPEKETAVAVRLLKDNQLEVIHGFELTSLFAGKVSYNNKRDYQQFMNRVNQKRWLEHWPKLQLHIEDLGQS